MDSFDNIIPIVGSRRPIVVPVFSETASSSSHQISPPSTLISTTTPVSLSRNRRKPMYVFKSPSADDPGDWEARKASHKRATPPYERRRTSTSTDTSRSSVHKFIPSVRTAVQRHAPLLPLYHPLGPLAQSLPKLDPGHFGLPSSLSVDEGDDQAEGDSNMGPSRSRRVGTKDDAHTNGTPNGVDKPVQDAPPRERNPSPRKRRGGGGSAKRKRKDTEDGDGVFPPPAKRTRNPRGAAANSSVPAAPSPLVVSEVVTADLEEVSVPENNGHPVGEAEEPEEAQEQQVEAQAPKRSTRVRKPRATRPAKRRDSSGSGSTSSVSISIATIKKIAALATSNGVTDDDHATQAEPVHSHQKPEMNGGDKHEEEEANQSPWPLTTASADKETLSAKDLPAEEHILDPQHTGKAVAMNGIPHVPSNLLVSPTPLPLATSLPPSPPAQKDPSPQREEREEGELTD